MSDRRHGLAVIVAGGGTGGHLYPGIAVARELLRREPAAVVSFAGTSRGLEARVVPREGFPLDTIRSAGLKGKSLGARFRGALLLVPSAIDAWRIVSKRRPRAVLGVGGYSSGPVVLIAALRGVPTMVLEQNAVPGVTNRYLARWVRAAAVTFEQTLPYFKGKGFVSGNPVRPEFFQTANFEDQGSKFGGSRSEFDVRSSEVGRDRSAQQAPRVLVLGGSQGAHAINMAVVAAAPRLVGRFPGLQLVHQTGERDLAAVREAYRGAGISARADSFIDAVAMEMTSADLIVCRAGATTLAELAASGRAAVLVPFPSAADDHQRKNARVLADAGAAVLLEQTSLSGDVLAGALEELLADRPRLQAMGRSMGTFARPDAASRIVDRLLDLVDA
jgi:UDP-N-acetylglucosamine--N-acetylmuramyl-(pentapeptide) pyrophosphoryl-undecaprenol N-acetylglucosamine transferase